ncbi:hypothetical protein PG999_014736 [Apiospora kogelbergensis]|uniref:Uncharacterized protein n=1 Tax=Apiospora kogelbergensis TaxID=1337665 RepID=A0AAW0Q4B3_9PEZI
MTKPSIASCFRLFTLITILSSILSYYSTSRRRSNNQQQQHHHHGVYRPSETINKAAQKKQQQQEAENETRNPGWLAPPVTGQLPGFPRLGAAPLGLSRRSPPAAARPPVVPSPSLDLDPYDPSLFSTGTSGSDLAGIEPSDSISMQPIIPRNNRED